MNNDVRGGTNQSWLLLETSAESQGGEEAGGQGAVSQSRELLPAPDRTEPSASSPTAQTPKASGQQKCHLVLHIQGRFAIHYTISLEADHFNRKSSKKSQSYNLKATAGF